MRLTLDHSTVSHGQVSILAVNGGNISHELIVLPLPTNQIVGTRPIGPDAKIDETGTLGEASNTCAQDSGDGIAPRRIELGDSHTRPRPIRNRLQPRRP